MKKFSAVLMGLFILATTGFAMADVTVNHAKPCADGHHISALCMTGKHLKKGSKGKIKPALNPQPLPPGVKAPPGQGGTEAK
jgi:hypothetical protein